MTPTCGCFLLVEVKVRIWENSLRPLVRDRPCHAKVMHIRHQEHHPKLIITRVMLIFVKRKIICAIPGEIQLGSISSWNLLIKYYPCANGQHSTNFWTTFLLSYLTMDLFRGLILECRSGSSMSRCHCNSVSLKTCSFKN